MYAKILILDKIRYMFATLLSRLGTDFMDIIDSFNISILLNLIPRISVFLITNWFYSALAFLIAFNSMSFFLSSFDAFICYEMLSPYRTLMIFFFSIFCITFSSYIFCFALF